MSRINNKLIEFETLTLAGSLKRLGDRLFGPPRLLDPDCRRGRFRRRCGFSRIRRDMNDVSGTRLRPGGSRYGFVRGRSSFRRASTLQRQLRFGLFRARGAKDAALAAVALFTALLGLFGA